MKNIRVEIKDWLFNAGLVGMYRILRHAEQQISRSENYIEFPSSALEHFEEYFFDYFSEMYKKDSAWYKATEFCKSQFPNLVEGDYRELDQQKVDAFIKNFGKSLVAASFKSAYEIITGDAAYIEKKLKVVKNNKMIITERLMKIKEIYDFLMDDENRKIILAKYVSYTVINNYWGGISFLNKQQVKKNMFKLYRKDFVDPVLKYIANENNIKNPFGNCMGCHSVLHKRSDGFEGLTWLKMDLDTNRKTSVYWNHNPDIIFCPVCYLVYSCVPAGFVTYRKKGLFVNDNGSSSGLISINNIAAERFGSIETMEDIENITYTNIINMIQNMREEHLKREIDNIQVVKYDSEKGYSFNILSKQVIEVIKKSKNDLNLLSKLKNVYIDRKNTINLYAEVIDRIYRNISLYPLISLLLGLSLRRKKGDMFAGVVFRINMNFIGGHMPEKKIYAMKQLGLQLKKGYKDKDEPNKIQGIAYRLLNNLKTKNINNFLDVVINSHMHIGKEVPTIFIECIHDVERFQAYGYAFLLGFTGEEYQPKEQDNEKNKPGN